MAANQPDTYEWAALSALAYEFPSTSRAEAEKKIKGRLKRKKLGAYDQARIDRLRQLKDELQVEIGLADKSRYYTGRHGKYCDVLDFDVPRLTRDMIARYPDVAPAEIENFVPLSVLYYYLL